MRERPKNADDNDREVVLEKAPDGKELIKITIKARVPGGKRVLLQLQVSLLTRTDQSDWFHRSFGQVAPRPTTNLQARALGSGYLEK